MLVGQQSRGKEIAMSTTASQQQKREIGLSAGRIRYRDTGGDGPPLVFVHGYLVDGRLWDGVVDALADRFRCIAPDLPFGAHRLAMPANADLSPDGLAGIVAELLERLELENVPPGLFKALPPLAKLPGSTWLMLQPMRIAAVPRIAFAPFSQAGIPRDYIAAWSEGAFADAGIRRDLAKVTAGMSKRYTLAAAEALRGSPLPILLAWAPGDRFFPMRYPRRLASEAGNARIVEIEGAKTFVPLDQPARLAAEIAQFAETR
jgi:pimeloyl-ACP methyl ester carboxylesterase